MSDNNERQTPAAPSPARQDSAPSVAAPAAPTRADSGRPGFWRVPEELHDAEKFQQALHDEFTPGAWQGMDVTDRRQFLKIMGASLALAGLQGCVRQPNEEIVAFAKTPEHMVPGESQFFATAIRRNGFGFGVLVESHDGRPTKIEGNPDHPASLGATDAITQAAVLGLYDPDRSQVVRKGSVINTWDNFTSDLRTALSGVEQQQGRGLRLLTGPVTSPTLLSQLRALQEKFPEAVWHQHDPLPAENQAAAVRKLFGRDVNMIHRLENADVILSLDAEFLYDGPANVRLAREFSRKRRVNDGNVEMSRFHAVDCSRSVTAAAADHRLPVAPGLVPVLAASLAERLGVKSPAAEATRTLDATGSTPDVLPPATKEFLDRVVDDLQNAGQGRSVVIAGDAQPAAVQALAYAINEALGNIGETVVFTEPLTSLSDLQPEALPSLVDAMNAGEVETLLILDANPVFTAPVDLGFREALQQVLFSIHHGLYTDETAAVCTWHIPATHDLESWSDVRAFDGTTTVMQPLIAPLYNGRSEHEVLATLLGTPGQTAHDIVRGYWRKQRGGSASETAAPEDQAGQQAADRNAVEFERWWKRVLHDGLVPDSAAEPLDVAIPGSVADAEATAERNSGDADPTGIELVFRPDPNVLDGRFANNAWLQELPRPFTKLTWNNAALFSPKLAAELGVKNEQVVSIERDGNTIRIPAWVVPGHPEQTVTLTLGHGRTAAGRVGDGIGTNVAPLRGQSSLWHAASATVTPTPEHQELACTQRHHLMDGRDLVKAGSARELADHPDDPPFMHSGHHGETDATFYPEWQYDDYKWGMSINLGACTGCNACVLACQSENNIPVVGAEQVSRGREMQWLRVDTYYSGSEENPEAYQQPVPCMHCEHAPCEPVCPVAATTHSDEGLNEMTYNRCIGTRYCSNNCPYKVRRFNFFDYNEESREEPVLQLLHNPNVTVRSRGVMEKCTYCVQRISAGRINAEKQGRQIRDGEVVTACQAVCPTNAIVFGNLNDETSAVAEAKQSPLDYALLAELNTRPRTTYQAAVRNPKPELSDAESQVSNPDSGVS